MPKNIIEFIETETTISLWPIQRFVLKMAYGLPLDYINKTIRVHDLWSDELLTEVEYLAYLKRYNRCSVPTEPFDDMLLALGRRSPGKTTLTALVALYEARELGENVLIVVADRDQRTMMGQSLTGLFDPAKAISVTPQKIAFEKGCIHINTASNVERGRKLGLLILDDCAFWVNDDHWARVQGLSDRRAYISSPNGCTGKFYDAFVNAEDTGALALEIHSGEGSPVTCFY